MRDKSMLYLKFIEELYDRYADDLRRVSAYQKNLCPHINVLSDDIECEISYLLVRYYKPGVIVDIGPNEGWSTSWLLHAIRDNGIGKVFSFDVMATSTRKIPEDLRSNRWEFIKGDAMEMMSKLPREINYLCIDADHYRVFAEWYLTRLLPLLKTGTPVSIHDIYHDTHPETHVEDERGLVMGWLKKNDVLFFSPSRFRDPDTFQTIETLRGSLGITDTNENAKTNSMLYFLSK